jgi:hypothetical protein
MTSPEHAAEVDVPEETAEERHTIPWYSRWAPLITGIVGAVATAAVLLMAYVAGGERDRADTESVRADVAEVRAEKGQDLATEVDRRCKLGGEVAAELGALCTQAREVQEEPVVESRDGIDGVGISRVDTGDCALTIRLTDGRSDTLSDLCGEPGKDAPPGRGIASTEQDGCFVTLTYTDALSQRLGPFCGIAGPQGEQGEKGEPGLSPPCMSEPTQCRGPIGERGADGNPAQSQTFTLPDGRTFSCARDEGSPATAPTYTCTQTAPPTEPEQPGGPLPIPGG